MSDIIIRAENLGKKYVIGHQAQRDRYMALRDVLMQNAKSLWNKTKDLATGKPIIQGDTLEEVWALRDVSFEVRRGEAVGIIGRNGAGKSTLLKVLSRITEPTTGRVTLKGRVASLLEVGTGFHPELTGRENIYLNGTILGMTRAEIKRKFDEIVAFAEIEKYLDTPVKRYSSGMYVRLAFAVAAHLEPEILLIDEVLAVGDMEFQKKCLGKMGDVTSEGRTVLFVSHNMSAVSELCAKAVLLRSGHIDTTGNVQDVIHKYSLLAMRGAKINLDQLEHAKRPQEYGYLTHLSIFDSNFTPVTTFLMGQSMTARIGVHIHHRMSNVEIGFKISSRTGSAIHYFCSTWEGLRKDLAPGNYLFEVEIPQIMLLPGQYIVGAWLMKERGLLSDDYIPDITVIEVIGSDFTGHSADFARYSISGGEVYAPSKWRMLESIDLQKAGHT